MPIPDVEKKPLSKGVVGIPEVVRGSVVVESSVNPILLSIAFVEIEEDKFGLLFNPESDQLFSFIYSSRMCLIGSTIYFLSPNDWVKLSFWQIFPTGAVDIHNVTILKGECVGSGPIVTDEIVGRKKFSSLKEAESEAQLKN